MSSRNFQESHDALAAECERLRAENRRLRELLSGVGIPSEPPISAPSPETRPISLVRHPLTPPTTDNRVKVALFKSLFRGRTDVYPVRWEGKSGKSGYAPACGNEWRPGICEKPRIKCSDCSHRQLLAFDDKVIYDHLAGRITAGVYPLLPDDTCWFLAVDFDDENWRTDAGAFLHSCREVTVPASMEISRSGKGAHVWIFFSEAVPAPEARRLGTALISHTCKRTQQLKLSSYDRLFPNQDYLPKGGFGNLIALPLQKRRREKGYSVFVDEWLAPYEDQWAYLSTVQRMHPAAMAETVDQIAGNGNVLDVAFIMEEDEQEPWRRRSP